jgi:hypothetical protein
MSTITITYAELSRLVAIVGPSAGKDKFLPIFTCIQIHSHEGRVELRATDRYTFAAARGAAKYDGPDILIRHADLKHLLSALRVAGAAGVTLDVDAEQERITATATDSQLDEQAVSLTVTYQVPKGEYPKFNPFKADWSGTTTHPSFNPTYLRHVPNLGETVTFASQGVGKPCGFFTKDWAVIIMPVRVEGDVTENWLARKDAEAA